MVAPITEELLVIDSFWERENSFTSEVATSWLLILPFYGSILRHIVTALNGLSVPKTHMCSKYS